MVTVLPVAQGSKVKKGTLLVQLDNTQHIAEILPATHFVRLIRGVVLRDVEIIDMSFDVTWLALFTLAGLILASVRFKKNLD